MHLPAVIDVVELALYASPFLLLAALLLSGRFVGEATILSRRVAVAVPRPRRRRTRWLRRDAFTPAFLPVHDPRIERGPPALTTAAV